MSLMLVRKFRPGIYWTFTGRPSALQGSAGARLGAGQADGPGGGPVALSLRKAVGACPDLPAAQERWGRGMAADRP